jgi:hypothetical protein
LFGDVGDETRLPEGEARAAETVARVVSGLAELGAVEPVADLAALRLTLGLELAGDLPREGRFGAGVLVAPLGSAIGLDADVVFAVGLAEELVRAQTGQVQVRSELSFGIRDHAAVRVRLADDRDIWFRGGADRVDRAGCTLVVLDYKTGSFRPFMMDIHTKVRGRFCSTSWETEREPAGPALCPACSISWDGTRQPVGG